MTQLSSLVKKKICIPVNNAQSKCTYHNCGLNKCWSGLPLGCTHFPKVNTEKHYLSFRRKRNGCVGLKSSMGVDR